MERSKEDYIRVIYTLNELNPDKGVRSVDISNSLGVTKASVSSMVKKLIALKLLKASPYSKLYLTKKGEDFGRRITHNHRVIEVFLTKVLGYKKNEESDIHNEACRLEHAFSQRSIKKIDTILNNPKISPHGRKIPHESKRS